MTFSLFDLTGRVALVTGGNHGIGLGIADGLARAGADVCVVGTNEARNAAAADALRSHGTRVLALQCDVSKRDEVERAFTTTIAELGRVDACFANAGVPSRGVAFEEISDDQLDRTFGVNLKGAFYTFQAAAKHMKERARTGDAFGRLVVTSSLSAQSGFARGEDYAATKGAVISLVKGLAVEYARFGITANAIVPGWIETGMTEEAFQSEKLVANIASRIPVRRFGKPEDFAGIAVYLASASSSYHTGDAIIVDGGYAIF